MKIFISHSSKFDFQKELYLPLMQADYYKEHEFIFPHLQDIVKMTKEAIKNCDLVIADVSLPSTGLGIELGWAESFNKPIICIYKDGTTLSEAVTLVSSKLLMYTSTENMIEDIQGVIQQYA